MQQFLPYWRNETSGKLAEAVHAYFDVAQTGTRNLTPSQIVILKSYIKIWADYPWHGDESQFAEIKKLADEIEELEDIDQWIGTALEQAIDPF